MSSTTIQSIKKIDISKKFFINYINLIKTFRETNITFDFFIKIINELPENHDIFILLNNNCEIVGTITTIIERKIINNGQNICHIEDLIISPNNKGKGYGTQLLEFIKSYSKEKECYKIILNCDRRLIYFYLKNNFIQNNVEMSYYLN